MNFIHESSQECAKSDLDLFHTPETQAMILSGKWVDYHPISVIDGNSPLEFTIPGSGDEYTDLSQTYLHVVARVQSLKFQRYKSCCCKSHCACLSSILFFILVM